MYSYQQKYETNMFASKIHSFHIWTQNDKMFAKDFKKWQKELERTKFYFQPW